MSSSEIRVVHASWVKLLYVSIDKYEENANAIFNQSGISPESIHGAYYVNKSKINTLYKALEQRKLLKKLPEMIANVVQVHFFGSIGKAMFNAGDLENYLKVTAYSVSRISPLVTATLHPTTTYMRLSLRNTVKNCPLDKSTFESILLTVYKLSKQVFPSIDGGIASIDIPGHSDRIDFTSLFRCDVKINDQSKYDIYFASDKLNAENLFADSYGSLSKTEHKIIQIRKSIHENLSNPNLSLNYIANLAGVSAKTLQRKLSKHNLTYRALLLEEQMKKAEKLLTSTSLSIKHISYEIGYATPASFCKSFKGLFGVTPSEFRKNFGVS